MSTGSGDTTVLQAMPGSRTVAAERGWAWIAEGWRLFLRAPGIWIAMILVLLVISFALNFIPLVGSIAAMVLQPVFVAGLVIATAKMHKGEEPQFADLFAGFQTQFGRLASVGAIYMAATVAIVVVAALVTGLGAFSLASAGAMSPAVAMSLLLAVLIVMALMVPLLMALWFAVPLVLFHNQGAVEAMKGSFVGCLRNIMPFLVYGVAGFVLAILACIPLMLGWLVLIPVFAATVYTGYRDIFLAA